MIIHLRRHAIYVLISIGLLLQFCITCKEKQHHPEPVTLRVVSMPFLSHAPFFIAEEEGYFAEQGLDVEFIKMISSAQAVPALVEGKVDVVPGAIRVSLLNAMARGAKIGFVADLGYVAPGDCVSRALMARRALVETGELDSPTQLKGRRIAINPASYSGYFVEKLLNTVDLALDDIEIVDIPTPAEPEALEKGAVDLVTSSEPWVTRMLRAEQAVVWMPAQQVIPDFQLAIVVYGPTLLDENTDAGRRFMVAYLKAVQQYNQGKTERNMEILTKHTGLDQELLNSCCWAPIRNDGQINVESLLDFQEWAVKKGYLDSPVTEDQFWDPSFIEHACQVLDIPSRRSL